MLRYTPGLFHLEFTADAAIFLSAKLHMAVDLGADGVVIKKIASRYFHEFYVHAKFNILNPIFSEAFRFVSKTTPF